MTLFKLPSTWCMEISKMIARFWWSGKDGKRPMYWVSWRKMAMPKDLGGMGFRDLGDFNDAMLTKTAWRLHHNPDSLWARVMRGLYYPKHSLTEAKKGARPSWAWNSILTGRDIIQNQGAWRVGDGKSIRVFEDNWVPNGSSAKPIRLAGRHRERNITTNHHLGDTDRLRTLKVADLISCDTRQWNLQLIEDHVTEQEK